MRLSSLVPRLEVLKYSLKAGAKNVHDLCIGGHQARRPTAPMLRKHLADVAGACIRGKKSVRVADFLGQAEKPSGFVERQRRSVELALYRDQDL